MSSGPIGEGMSYWATIKVTKQMSKEELQTLKKKIQDLIAAHGGTIEDEARASTAGQSAFSVAFRKRGGS